MLNVVERYPLCKHARSSRASDREKRALRCPGCRYDQGMAIVLYVFKTVLISAVMAVVLTLSCGARGSEPLLTVMQRLPTYYEDRSAPELKAVQLTDMATAIEAAADPPPAGVKLKDWQALIVAIAWHESTLSLRIHRGDCKPHECDGGKARGPWQQHRLAAMSDQDWEHLHGLDHVTHQAATAAGMLRRSYLTCRGSNATWLQGTINNYAGRNCTATGWAGLEERQETWTKIRKRL